MQQYSVACVRLDALRGCEAILERAAHTICVIHRAVRVGGIFDDGGEALSPATCSRAIVFMSSQPFYAPQRVLTLDKGQGLWLFTLIL